MAGGNSVAKKDSAERVRDEIERLTGMPAKRDKVVSTPSTAGQRDSVSAELPPPNDRKLVTLRLAYRIAQMCDAHPRDHRRVAKDGWHAGEVVEEPNARAEKHRRNINVKLVEESAVQ